MNILIRNSDNVVVYAEYTLTLTATELSGSNWIDNQFNTTNATVVDVLTIPQGFKGGIWSYTTGVWAVVDQGRYDELLQEAKASKLQQLKAHIASITKPRVTTSLGYDVDGGRDNKDDFFSKWETMADADVTTVRDADNQFHPNTTKVQMQTIYRAIVANGEAILVWKWTKEQEITACTTIEQLEAIVI
jgi:hypothetical protein